MATEKQLKTRLIQKHDIEANWNKATSFIPKDGEFIVYDIDANYNYKRLKIGDGVTSVINLPFFVDNNSVSPEQFGAKGDGVTDDSQAFIDALMSGNKVICDNNKTYYFTKPIDVRTLTQGHLDGNWANFVNFHIYVNINDEFTDWRTEWSSGKFIIENMNFGKEDSWLELPEGWETPLITTGSPMVIRNINTRYPYVLATVERYIDIMTCENWSANFNWDLYSNSAINLDAISCLNSAGVYTRCNDASCVIEAGDGWKISQCQEFHSKNARPEYYMMHITSRQPILVESCIQCNFDVAQYSKATFLNCHWESHSTVTFTSNYMVWALFMNCYFYQNYVINDAPSTTYKNCHFRSGVEATDSTIPFAYSTGNKFLFDMQCTFEDCVFSNNSRITTSHLLANKNMPKKTYNYQVIDYRDVSVDGLHYIDLSQYPNRAHFATLGTYTYDVYWKLTSLETVAAEHYVWTYNVENAKTCLWNDFQFANGGSSFVIVRTNPNGKMEYTKYYGDPNAFEKAIDYSAIKFRDYGNYAIFSVNEHDEHITEIEPWIAIDAKPEISINANLYEANGVLVTSDGSVFEHSKYKKYGYIQPATVAMLGNKLDKDGKLQSLMLTEKTDWAGENGYRCFASKELTSYHNGRGVFLVSSRHNGTGVLSFAYGCNSGTVNANTVYANITYVGTNTSPENIDKDNAWQAWFNPTNNTMYFFCHCYEYDHVYLTDVAEKGYSKLPLLDSPIWMTTIDSATYGAKVCGLDIIRKIAVDNNLSDSSINPVENRVITAAIKNVEDKIVQGDWSQNDETAPDYIKNRTHYAKDPVKEIYIEETTINIDGTVLKTDSTGNDLSNGKTYYVIWDGTEYECVCTSKRIGNASLADSTKENTGEPFCILQTTSYSYDPNSGAFTSENKVEYYATTSGSHTFSVYHDAVHYETISSNYLPQASDYRAGITSYSDIKNNIHKQCFLDIEKTERNQVFWSTSGSSLTTEYALTGVKDEWIVRDTAGKIIGKYFIDNTINFVGTLTGPQQAPTLIYRLYATDIYTGYYGTLNIYFNQSTELLLSVTFSESKKIQPDWNQNDDTTLDYVKNRTHYIGDPVATVLLEETSITTNEMYDPPYAPVSEFIDFIEGYTYLVTFNNTEYECVAYYEDDSGGIIIGNGSLFDGESGNGEPFMCISYVGEGCSIYTQDAGTYTLKIVGIIPEVVQLPAQFLINSNIRNGQGHGSIIEGLDTAAIGRGSHAEGAESYAAGDFSHAEGCGGALGEWSHAEGDYSTASGYASHAEGQGTTASGDGSHSEGYETTASGNYSHAEGEYSTAFGDYSHAEGESAYAFGRGSHAEGQSTCAIGYRAHSEGRYTVALSDYSHAEGYGNHASIRLTGDAGSTSYTVFDLYSTVAIGDFIDAGDAWSIVTGYDASTKTITLESTLNANRAFNREYASWYSKGIASGKYSHSEGFSNKACGDASHAEGSNTVAYGHFSHAEGQGTIANDHVQHVQGRYNLQDTEKKYAHIVGNGTEDACSNAHTIDWNGLGWFAGGLKVGGTGQDDTNAVEVATKNDLVNNIAYGINWGSW